METALIIFVALIVVALVVYLFVIEPRMRHKMKQTSAEPQVKAAPATDPRESLLKKERAAMLRVAASDIADSFIYDAPMSASDVTYEELMDMKAGRLTPEQVDDINKRLGTVIVFSSPESKAVLDEDEQQFEKDKRDAAKAAQETAKGTPETEVTAVNAEGVVNPYVQEGVTVQQTAPGEEPAEEPSDDNHPSTILTEDVLARIARLADDAQAEVVAEKYGAGDFRKRDDYSEDERRAIEVSKDMLRIATMDMPALEALEFFENDRARQYKPYEPHPQKELSPVAELMTPRENPGSYTPVADASAMNRIDGSGNE